MLQLCGVKLKDEQGGQRSKVINKTADGGRGRAAVADDDELQRDRGLGERKGGLKRFKPAGERWADWVRRREYKSRR